jgi:hypothetical protein
LKLIEIPDVSFAMLTAINNRLLHTHTQLMDNSGKFSFLSCFINSRVNFAVVSL